MALPEMVRSDTVTFSEFEANPDSFEPTEYLLRIALQQWGQTQDENIIRNVRVTPNSEYPMNEHGTKLEWEETVTLSAEVFDHEANEWQQKSTTIFPLSFSKLVQRK